MERTPLHSLKEVNDLLLNHLYDQISGTNNTSELVELTEAVAKLNSSFKNNGQIAEDRVSEEERLAQEEKDNFASCAEGEIISGDYSQTS